jgi:protein gp37
MNPTGIPYADVSWHPVRGCTRNCPGCWAARTSYRLSHNPNPKVSAPHQGLTMKDPETGKVRWTGAIRSDYTCFDELACPGRVVFVSPMGDLFCPKVTTEFQYAVLDQMCIHTQHTYLLLTKQPTRMQVVVNGYCAMKGIDNLPEHIWGGVSVTCQHDADRIGVLARTLFTNRWVSYEPVLGAIYWNGTIMEVSRGLLTCHGLPKWIVMGCQSGPDRKNNPMMQYWARDLLRYCCIANRRFYLKQLEDDSGRVIHAPELNGHQWLELPFKLRKDKL